MLVVELESDVFKNDAFVFVSRVADAIAMCQDTAGNLPDLERQIFPRIHAGVFQGKLHPLHPENLMPLSKNDYRKGIVSFDELVEWGYATKSFEFRQGHSIPDLTPTNEVGYIPYPIAKNLLADRLGATPEEIAAWLWLGWEKDKTNDNTAPEHALRAYSLHEPNPPRRFFFHIGEPELDLQKTMADCYFVRDEVVCFTPKERYVTAPEFIKELTEYTGNREEAEAQIQNAVREGLIMAFHPNTGLTQWNDPNPSYAPMDKAIFLRSHANIILKEFCRDNPPPPAIFEAPDRQMPTESKSDVEWFEIAKTLAKEYILAWRKKGFEPTVDDAALYVEGVFLIRKIFGPRDEILYRATIKRKALKGVTGNARGFKSKRPKVPENQRGKMPENK